MAETDWDLSLFLRQKRYGGLDPNGSGRVAWQVIARSANGNTTYELTKEYDSSHEAMSAFSSTLRKLTVETSGDGQPTV